MLTNLMLSLKDILGEAYAEALQRAAATLYGMPEEEAARLCEQRVAFFPEGFAKRADELTGSVGKQIMPPFVNDNDGAPTVAFAKATHKAMAPLGGLGWLRLGEDGRLYFAGKSEHYHTPLGHSFPGYQLVRNAQALHVPNATHNNTRGYITRLAERRLIQSANGVDWEDEAALSALLASQAPHVLNRVINLETGSLAVEAGIKMMLARFYRLDKTCAAPKYGGYVPVFFVMQDNDGGPEANYHGTTVIAQTLRGMWPELYSRMAASDAYCVVPVALNDIADFEAKMKTYNTGKYKTAGFLHEIVLMNYGGIRLTPKYLRAAYTLCRAYDTPVMVDEIQSCMWYEGMFLFRQYGLEPDFVIVGKGFPGGEYPASKIITTYEMDALNQFGALVTNGQEELASLSYLVTMAFVRRNGAEITRASAAFEAGLRAVQMAHAGVVRNVEGSGYLSALHFDTVAQAVRFCTLLNDDCIDVSAQTYKANCPPAALLKPPVILSDAARAFLLQKIERAAAALEEG